MTSAAAAAAASAHDIRDDLCAVQMISGTEENVEEEQLSNDVDDVEEFRRRVQSDEIISVSVANPEAEKTARQEVAYACAAAGPVTALVLEVMVEVADHVLDGFLATLWVESVLDSLIGVDEVVDVDTGTVV